MKLTQFLKNKNMDLLNDYDKNIFLLAPCAAGKSFYVLNELAPNRRILYLCDTINLRTQVKKDLEKAIEKGLKTQMNIMCYHQFGYMIEKSNNSIIENFDIIIADECQNLLKFAYIDGNKGLSIACEYLLKLYDNTKIIMMTATPEIFNKQVERFPSMDENYIAIDLLYEPLLDKYINRSTTYIHNYKQVEIYLKNYEDSFRYRGEKMLIYTPTISTMLELEEICKRFPFLNPICLWSTNNKTQNKHPMSEEQLKVRENLILTGQLLSPYNVLIINASTETGINITDDKFEMMLVNSTNETTVTQARGRIRKDIDLCILRTDDLSKVTLILEDEHINTFLTSTEFRELIKFYNCKKYKDKSKKKLVFISLNDFIETLKTSGYEIINKRPIIDGKKITGYIITNKK